MEQQNTIIHQVPLPAEGTVTKGTIAVSVVCKETKCQPFGLRVNPNSLNILKVVNLVRLSATVPGRHRQRERKKKTATIVRYRCSR